MSSPLFSEHAVRIRHEARGPAPGATCRTEDQRSEHMDILISPWAPVAGELGWPDDKGAM